jgi:S-adenosylmethionine/arginine decarboxylase-like enzyme
MGIIWMKKLFTTQIDLYDCKRLPRTVEENNDFLINLVSFIGMRRIPEDMIGSKNPHSFYFDVNKLGLPEDEAGITGTITLFESHSASHLWEKTNFACVVICSCKEYYPEAVAEFCRKYFDSSSWDIS